MPKTTEPILPGLQTDATPAPVRKKRVTKAVAPAETSEEPKKTVRRKAAISLEVESKPVRVRKSVAKPKVPTDLPPSEVAAPSVAKVEIPPVAPIQKAEAPVIPELPPGMQNPPDAIVEKGRGEGVIRVSHYPPYQKYSAPAEPTSPPPAVSTQSSYPPYPGSQNRPQQNSSHGSDSNQREGRFNRRDRGRRDRPQNRDGRNDGRNDHRHDHRNEGDRPNFSNQESGQPTENQEFESFDDSSVQTGPYEPVFAEGLVEVSPKGFGFLREAKKNYVQSPSDIFVTPEVIRRYLLRDGQFIKGETRRGSRGPQLFKLTEINGEDPERYTDITPFEELTSINPDQRIKLETVPERYTTRVIDLVAPIGKGQRGLIVAPPRTGKTTLLQHIADGVLKNHPSMKLIILLVDERPEEVTEIRRTFPQAEIMASSNDGDLKSHTRICQLAIERAKRLVEAEEDVFILLDSITRVARAFNNATSGGGRTGSGGLDTRAMEIPRRLFAAARNTEQAGSLTIVATALVETGSLMDEVIFQEFKGTGNMELVLDRKIAEQRIYPAVDIFKSGTRREELLLTPHDLEKINTIRRGLAGHRPGEAIERLLSFLRKFPTNSQMLREIPVAT